MPIPKPAAVFDRTHEWDELARFCVDPAPGLRIGVVRGRRRHGKSFLLGHLCRAVDGVYTLALQQSRAMALDRFADSLARGLGFRVGRFTSWVEAMDTAADVLTSRRDATTPPLLVLDEFPYLVAHSPELPSVLQALYDQRGPSSGRPPLRIVLCGSAISTMSTLLAGDQALRGRAVLDMRIGPFGFRDAAEYWGVSDPDTAFLVDAVLGGAAGYRDVIGDAPESVSGERGEEGFYRWLSRSVFNPSHILFTEPEYLLAEDPRISDRATYHAIWEAVASGAATPTQIGGLVGMDARSLTYHLNIMKAAAFIRYDQDLLLQRKPVITVADPIVRFHDLIVRPNLVDFEMREGRAAWERSRETFSSKVLGPHFEDLARQWTLRYGRERGLDDIGQVGTTAIPCREHRGHEVDVVALSRTSRPRDKGARITVIGEAKATDKHGTAADVRRLEHIRELLCTQGWDAGDSVLALFTRSEPAPDLVEAERAGRVLLMALWDVYGTG
ncbi:ATPase [Streptomyces sp. NTH33]|uniref:ATP-binding protein n=1 Tax=Streptomyces sp. NTH33 TaxID=1735453 RepID=UPI000DA7D6CA|nr:ATP-binding protein [Streptomyces sp. NTH33]PZG97490.1 ATPase [Streptomyces sp. NTH33]